MLKEEGGTRRQHESRPELIVKLRPEVALPFAHGGAHEDHKAWLVFEQWTKSIGAEVRPCFPLMARRMWETGHLKPGVLSPCCIDRFVSVLLRPDGPAPRELLGDASLLPGVDSVEVAPAGGPPPQTPDYTGQQTYLDTGAGHVAARDAWVRPGGAGTAVRVCICDHGFRATHEDLPQVNVVTGQTPDQLGRIGNTNYDHGTNVIGLIAAMQDQKGVTGIAYGGTVNFACVDDLNRKATIDAAINSLGAGDVLVLEMQAQWDHQNTTTDVPQEFDYAIRQALKCATCLGIIVVEAAGNGTLDLALVPSERAVLGQIQVKYIWNKGSADFDDSGAIIVGAGDPANQTCYGDSNWGNRVDCQGWGKSIVTAGHVDYGSDLPNNMAPSDVKYTTAFGKTSGATAMIAGVVACLQGATRGANMPALTPKQVRDRVSDEAFGTKQPAANAASKPIGPLPNLGKLV
jgi:serine protease